MSLLERVKTEWILLLTALIVGSLIGGVLTLAFFSAQSSVGYRPPLVIRDRVKSVMSEWSGKRPPIQDNDNIETIWADTRQMHDFDFQPGGADELCKMLYKEFKNEPTKPITLQPSDFGPKGKLLKVDDLVQRIEAY